MFAEPFDSCLDVFKAGLGFSEVFGAGSENILKINLPPPQLTVLPGQLGDGRYGGVLIRDTQLGQDVPQHRSVSQWRNRVNLLCHNFHGSCLPGHQLLFWCGYLQTLETS